MTCFLAFALSAISADEPKEKPEPQAIEDVLGAKTKPNDKAIIVKTHLLVHEVNGKHGMSVKFIDAKPSPHVNIKKWDKGLEELKPDTTITVTGQLHFGPVSGNVPSIRYKVVDVNGKKYNDHRHWRTDQAIYIINPTYEIAPQK